MVVCLAWLGEVLDLCTWHLEADELNVVEGSSQHRAYVKTGGVHGGFVEQASLFQALA